MEKVKILMVCGVFALMVASCSTKQRAINQLESFSTELRDNSRYYDLHDWEKAGSWTILRLRRLESVGSRVSVPVTWPVARRTM